MAIVMGLDQHRAQITAEWIDTDTGELGRARISPALRGDVRRFVKRFAGQPLEVALEATTGWRFVVEELHAVGAEVHLAEPAETAARRGNKKRAKTDRAAARSSTARADAARRPDRSWRASCCPVAPPSRRARRDRPRRRRRRTPQPRSAIRSSPPAPPPAVGVPRSARRIGARRHAARVRSARGRSRRCRCRSTRP